MEHQQLLANLVEKAKLELDRVGYSKNYRNSIETEWKKFLAYAKATKQYYYAEKLAATYLIETYGIYENVKEPLTRDNLDKIRSIRMLGDVQLHGILLHRYRTSYDNLQTAFFLQSRKNFGKVIEKSGKAPKTKQLYVHDASIFMEYLEVKGFKTFENLSIETINDYIKTLCGYSYKSIALTLTGLRTFITMLENEGHCPSGLEEKIPQAKGRKLSRVPSCWTPEEIQKVLAVIDTANPVGKRNYAMILLSSLLGLRCIDIIRLKLQDIDWINKTLTIIQQKTGAPLLLPIPNSVGWALIEYIEHGRPKINSQFLFLKKKYPYEPYTSSGSLYDVIEPYIMKSGICSDNRSKGFHSLRHSLASWLIEAGTPLMTVSDILGHLNPDSSKIYIKTGIEQLRKCTIEFKDEGVCHGK